MSPAGAAFGGRPRDVNVREVLNGPFYVLWTGCEVAGAAQGPAAEVDGTHYFMLWDLGRHARAHPPRALCGGTRPGRARGEPIGGGDTTARAPRERKKGSFARPAGLRCGKKVTGRQAPHPRRYTRPVVERHRPSRSTCRIATAPASCFEPRAVRSPSSRPSSPTAATRGGDFRMARPSPRPAAGSWKSLSASDGTASCACEDVWIVERTFALDRSSNRAPRESASALWNRCRLRPSR